MWSRQSLHASAPSTHTRWDTRIEPTGQEPPPANEPYVESSFFVEYLSLEIRPELRCQIADQAEPERHRTLGKSEAHRIDPVRIPLVREERGAIRAADTPRGQRLAAAIGAREQGSTERMSR